MPDTVPATEDIGLLSAGAVKTLVAAIADAFGVRSGVAVRLAFATAPVVESTDFATGGYSLIAAPRRGIGRLVEAGRLAVAARVPLQSVGIGLVGRTGHPAPDISSEDAFRQALRGADEIIFNAASSGLHIESVIKRLGLSEEVSGRINRVATGRDVMMTIAAAPDRAIAFGATTEIDVHRALGVHVAAPLPPGLQNETIYDLVAISAAPAEEAARALVAFVGSPDADACFASSHAERAA